MNSTSEQYHRYKPYGEGDSDGCVYRIEPIDEYADSFDYITTSYTVLDDEGKAIKFMHHNSPTQYGTLKGVVGGIDIRLGRDLLQLQSTANRYGFRLIVLPDLNNPERLMLRFDHPLRLRPKLSRGKEARIIYIELNKKDVASSQIRLETDQAIYRIKIVQKSESLRDLVENSLRWLHQELARPNLAGLLKRRFCWVDKSIQFEFYSKDS